MNSLTLTFAELERLLKAFAYASVGATGIITAAQILLFDKPPVTATIQSAGIAILLLILGFGVLAKKPWLWPTLAGWFGRPIVHGLWWGTLHTEYRPNINEKMPPILIALVIRQSYLSLSIRSFTQKQPASSTLETLYLNEKNMNAELRYVFEMVRRAYAENKLTNGYGELSLQNNGKKLAGHYWTNSPTQGRLELYLVRRNCDGVNSFDDARRICE